MVHAVVTSVSSTDQRKLSNVKVDRQESSDDIS